MSRSSKYRGSGGRKYQLRSRGKKTYHAFFTNDLSAKPQQSGGGILLPQNSLIGFVKISHSTLVVAGGSGPRDIVVNYAPGFINPRCLNRRNPITYTAATAAEVSSTTGGGRYCFDHSLSVCLSVCLRTRLLKQLWLDFHQITGIRTLWTGEALVKF